MKVRDLAKELGKTPKELIRFLMNVDIKVKSPTTKLDDDTVVTIKELIQEEASNNSGNQQMTDEEDNVFYLSNSSILLKDLAVLINVSVSDIMRVVLNMGLLLNLNSEIDEKTAIEIASKLDIELIAEEEEEYGDDQSIRDNLDRIAEQEAIDQKETLIERPPVITIMGHVDHGKTLLLDAIRMSNVVDNEAGGITQHIGAYQVKVKKKFLTFLDTPGHEAFTTLRARGAQVTDITIIVVAADDGVMPQTVEAIRHAQAADVPIIVAINKMDKPEANIDKVKQQLTQYELVAEDWGGKTIMVPLSAKTKEGIDELLEMILLVSEMMELKASLNGMAKGVVIESRLSRQKGPVATILVKSGTLSIGDFFVIGSVQGKVRALLNDQNESIQEAIPGMPVEIMGISEVPRPGDILEVFELEKEARSLAGSRKLDAREAAFKNVKQISLKSLAEQIDEGKLLKLNVIVKADVHGSLEAVVSCIEQIPTDKVEIKVLHSATGPINENDIMLARASEAFVIGFNVNINSEAAEMAANEKIEAKTYKIIYEIVDDIKRVLEGLFEPEFEELENGKIEVRQIFKYSKVGSIAGCYVLEGKVHRNCIIQVTRDRKEIFKGKIGSLKRFKEDTKEVAAGYECGIVLEGFNDLAVGDTMTCYEIVKKELKL